MRIIGNNVLVKPAKPNEIILVTGLKLYLDTRFEEEKSSPQYGTVIEVPEYLRYSDNPDNESTIHETEMELQKGDLVIFHYGAIKHARKHGLMIGEDCMVRYDSIYAAIRDNEVIVINGGVIVEPDIDVVDTSLVIPTFVKDRKSEVSGTVKYASKFPVKKIRFSPIDSQVTPMLFKKNGEFEELGRFVKPGDKVKFHYSNSIPVQHYFQLNGQLSKTMLYRMQHHDIEVVIE